MLGRERVHAVLSGQRPDRCPVQYQFLGGAHRVLDAVDMSLRAASASSSNIAATQIAAAELFGHDTAMAPWGCLTVEAEAFGCDLEYYDQWYPQVRSRPLADSTDLTVLPDVAATLPGRMALTVESLRELRSRSGDDLFTIAMVVSPFLVACELRDMTQLMLDIGVRPGFVTDLLAAVTDGLCAYVDAIAATGAADAIMFENAGMAADLLGPHHVAQFIRPHHRRLVGHARRVAPDSFLIEHNCADGPYIDEIIATEVDAVSLATPDLAIATQPRPAQRPLIAIGAVDHGELMLKGSPDEVEAAARDYIHAAGDRPFILSTGCEIPFKAPIDNITALARAARSTAN